MSKNQSGVTYLELFFMFAVVVTSLFAVTSSVSVPLISTNSGRMSAYGSYVTGKDGRTYRATVTNHYEPGKSSARMVDMYSLDSKYVNIFGMSQAPDYKWQTTYACSKEDFQKYARCPSGNDEVKEILDYVVLQTMRRSNLKENFDAYWAWEKQGKELFEKLRKP